MAPGGRARNRIGSARLGDRRQDHRALLRVLRASRGDERLSVRRPRAARNARRAALRPCRGPRPALDGRHGGRQARSPAPDALPHRGRLSTALCRRTRPDQLVARSVDRRRAGATSRGARSRHRARARPCPPARRSRADLRRPLRGHAPRDQPGRRLVETGLALHLRAHRRRFRPHSPLAETRASGGRAGEQASPAAATTSQMRCCGSIGRPSWSSSPPRRPPSRSMRWTPSRTRASRACSRRILRWTRASDACASRAPRQRETEATRCRPKREQTAARRANSTD